MVEEGNILKKRIAIVRNKNAGCSLGKLLSVDFEIVDMMNEYLLGEECDLYIISFCGGEVDKNIIAQLIKNKKKLLYILSFSNKIDMSYIYKNCSGIVFLPVSKSYLVKSINNIIDTNHCTGNQIIIDYQYNNIIQLQNIIKKMYHIDPNLKHKIHHDYVRQSEENRKKNEILINVKKGMERNEFCLYFQPVVDLKTEKIFGFEALIRWITPSGIVPPDDFIPYVEESDLIYDLTYTVIEGAAIALKKWEDELGIKNVRVNVNISARHFHLPELSKRIEEYVDKYSIDNERLGIELTESAFIEDMESANLNFLKLKSMNHTLYMDDFGTGYSSLSYLQHFPVGIIKIDKSFVTWMHVDEQSESIVKSIIALAHGLDMKIVAEGVEEKEHINILKSFGCDYAQGYYYSKPISLDDSTEYLKKEAK